MAFVDGRARRRERRKGSEGGSVLTVSFNERAAEKKTTRPRPDLLLFLC